MWGSSDPTDRQSSNHTVPRGTLPAPKQVLTNRVVHEALRNEFGVHNLRALLERPGAAYSCVIFGSGALGCAMAAAAAGFKLLWATEISKTQRRMWTAFTRKKCYGDTAEKKWQDDHKGIYAKSSAECTEYSLGSTTLRGENSTSGAQYIEQVKYILLTGAIIACLEMVGNAINVNGGAAIKTIRKLFKDEGWHTVVKMIYVVQHGDACNKTHVYIMALDEKEFGARAKDFRFPKPAYSDENAFTGRDIIQPDTPARFERKHAGDKPIPQRKMLKGRLQKLGQIRPGQGPSGLTYALYGLDGTNPVPTRFGAGRHVLEDWRPGDSFEDTAMWTPDEALVAKSYSDEYIEFVKQFDSSDEFLYECVGKGIAFLTGKAIDDAVIKFLDVMGTPKDVVETTVIKVTKGDQPIIIKHRVEAKPTPKWEHAEAHIIESMAS